jgi:hypothetical protein
VGLKDGLGDRFLWLRAVAGHDANYLLPLLDGRPAAAFTVVREPVDRVLSRYYFLSRTPSWTLEDLYLGRWDKQIPGFFSGQAKTLLEPLCDTSGIPKTADEPGADEWRERLEQALAAYVVVGTQDRLEETIDALGSSLASAGASSTRCAYSAAGRRPRRSSRESQSSSAATTGSTMSCTGWRTSASTLSHARSS